MDVQRVNEMVDVEDAAADVENLQDACEKWNTGSIM